MDPTQLLIDLLEAAFSMAPEDIQELRDKAEEIAKWRFHGGFPPNEPEVLKWLIERDELRTSGEWLKL